MKDDRLANNVVLEKLGLIADTVNTASEEALLKANGILKTRDFYSKIGVDQYESLISDEVQQILTRAQSHDSTLIDQDYSKTESSIIRGDYPFEIRKISFERRGPRRRT